MANLLSGGHCRQERVRKTDGREQNTFSRKKKYFFKDHTTFNRGFFKETRMFINFLFDMNFF